MRIISTIILLFFVLSSASQDDLYSTRPLSSRPIDLSRSDTVLHFFQSGGDIVWQNIYECPETAKEVLGYFADLKILEDVKVSDSTLRAKRSRGKINTEALKASAWYGYSMLIGFPHEYRVKIDARDGRYRVTLSQITFFPDINIGLYSHGVSVGSNTNSMYDLSLIYNFNRNKFKKQFRDRDANVLDRVFFGDFDISMKQVTPAEHTNDW